MPFSAADAVTAGRAFRRATRWWNCSPAAYFSCWCTRYGLTPFAGKMCVFTAMLVALFFSDLEERILPDEFTVWGTVVGLVFALFAPTQDGTAGFLLWIVGLDSHGWITRLAAAVVAAGLPAGVLWFAGWLYSKARHREGVGLGDVKMVALLGCYLGLEAACSH